MRGFHTARAVSSVLLVLLPAIMDAYGYACTLGSRGASNKLRPMSRAQLLTPPLPIVALRL